MAEIATIGLELDVSHLARSGQVAEGVLNKLARGAKLSTAEVRQLTSALGGAGASTQEAIIRTTQLGRTLQQTQTQARATTQLFQQLRGGMASMAQSAIGQAVPGLSSVTTALGSFAIGSPALVAALAGLAGLALAFRHLSADAREVKKASDEAIAAAGKIGETRASALRGQQFDIGIRVGDIDAILADPGLHTRGQLRKLKEEREEALAAMKRTEREIGRIHREEQENAAKESKRAAKEAERAWAEAAEAAAREWQRFLGTSKTGTLSDLAKDAFEFRSQLRLFNQGVPQVGFTGRQQELRERLGNILVPTMPRFGPAGDAPVQPGFLKNLGSSILQQLDPKALITNLATSGVNAFLGVVGDFVTGIFDSTDEAERAFKMWLDNMRTITTAMQLSGGAAEEFAAVLRVNEQAKSAGINVRNIQDLTSLTVFIAALENMARRTRDQRELQKYGELIEQARLEQERLNEAIEEMNRVTQENEQLRIFELQGRDAEALALRHSIELRQAEEQQLDETTKEIIRRRQELERERLESQKNTEERRKQRSIRDSIVFPGDVEREEREDLEVRRARAEGRDRDAAIRELELKQKRELDEARRTGKTQEFIDELIAIHKIEMKNLIDSFAEVFAGAGAAAGSALSPVEQSIVRNVTRIAERSAFRLISLGRSQLGELQTHTRLLTIIAGQGALTSTRGSGSAGARTASGVNQFLGHQINEEVSLSGDSTV